jgi:hypothetical protein
LWFKNPGSLVVCEQDRASADDELDVPVVGALLLALRVAVGALEDAAGAFLPSGPSVGLPDAGRIAFLPVCLFGLSEQV